MNRELKQVSKLKIERAMKALEKNNMQPFYAESAGDVVPIVKDLMKKGDTVTVGGSSTLFETGVIDLLSGGDYRHFDRYKKGITHGELQEIYQKAFSADVYISSANAITENGEIYNVDGNSNRVAAILYGPKKVIIVAGANKIVKDLNEAVCRVKSIAAPANAMRLNYETGCLKSGRCVSFSHQDYGMGDGCLCDARICCNYTVSAFQRHKDRIKVILVNQELGF